MEAKEKAKELVNKFKESTVLSHNKTKQCALICVSQERLAVKRALESCNIRIEDTQFNEYYNNLSIEINAL